MATHNSIIHSVSKSKAMNAPTICYYSQVKTELIRGFEDRWFFHFLIKLGSASMFTSPSVSPLDHSLSFLQRLLALPRRELRPLSTVLSTLISTLSRPSILTAAKRPPVTQMPGVCVCVCVYVCVCVCVCVCVLMCTNELIPLTGMSSTRRSSGEGVLMLLEITSLLRSWRSTDPPCLHLLLKVTKVNKKREQLLVMVVMTNSTVASSK